jgi:hypothetical protein
MTVRMLSASPVARLGLEIDVAGRPAFPEGGQEHPAFQDELVGKARLGQAGEERLEDVEVQQFVDRAAIAAGLGPQVEIGPTCRGGSGGRGHSKTSKARRSAGSVRGNL